MEHLPTINNPTYPLPTIPCVCSSDDYDGLGMLGFPERMGWRIDGRDGPVRFDKFKSLIVEPVALLQAWFFFGLLQDIFSIGETDIDSHNFQQQVGGQNYLSTAPLKNSLTKLESNTWQKNLEPEVCLQRRSQAAECFVTLARFLDHHWDTLHAKQRWNVTSILSLDHIMVFVTLGETLKNATIQIWPVFLESSPLLRVPFRRPRNPLRNRFLQAGWCPSEASMLFNELDNTALFLATMLRRPFSDNLSHKLCSDQRCLALQTSDEDYETKHVEDCLSCGKIVIDQERICSILRCGGIPVIYVHTTKAGEISKVKIIDYSANSVPYVAISHVWAHGLGNPKDNALPSCQIMRLDALVANTSTAALEIRKQAFWIDTLCIPVDPKFKEFRKLAITRLDGAFRDARRVLVLDADLHRFSGPCSRTELAIRIVCCGWMRRLWTLAEAVVADETANATKVDIQFLGGSTDFNGIAGRDINHIYHTEAAMLSIFTAFPQFLSRERAFGSVWQALKYRSTSKMEDEAICLASIFGFGSKDIASIAGAKTAEERMHLMYTLLDQIPASILFNTTKKLTNGFGWAPASLIGSLGMRPSHSKAGRCDAQGLHVQFSGYVGIRDSPSPSILDHPFTLEWYIGDPGEAAPTLAIRAYRGLAMARDLPPDKSVELDAIELRKLLKEIPTLAIILDPDEENHSAALVSVSREEGGIIYATFKANLSISRRKKGKDRHGGWRDLLINVRQVPPEQEWCIQ